MYIIILASDVAQKRLDEMLENIESSIIENQPKSNWQKRMEVREENWEAFRSRLFEEVVLYSTMPPDSVREVL